MIMVSKEIKKELEVYLKQDLGKGDVTARVTPRRNCTATITSNENCYLAGVEEVSYLFSSRKLKVKSHKKDGEKTKKNQKILSITGENRKILSLERMCLNILGRMSGVATLCTEAKKKAGKTRLAVTRKTAPGFQLLDKKAAETAGVWSHRKNLFEMVLLKENHLKFFDSIREAVAKAKKTGKKVEAEAETQKDALEAAKENPFIIMLDDFSPKKAKETIILLRKNGFAGKIELSGGITIKNLSKYSKIGADIISMGELTKKANMVDFSLRVVKAK